MLTNIYDYGKNKAGLIVALFLTASVIYNHRANIKRLLNGTERKNWSKERIVNILYSGGVKHGESMCIRYWKLGKCISFRACKKGNDVSMWTRKEEQAKKINRTKENTDYLPGVLFPNNITISTDIEKL